MNKSELIDAVAERAELSKAAVNKAIDALTEVITAAITTGNSVALIGFGTFKSVLRAARTGKNPQTGAVLKIAAKSVPKFSAGAGLKAAVAGKKPAAKKPAAKKVAAKPVVKAALAKKPAAKPVAAKAAVKPAVAKTAAKPAAKPVAAKAAAAKPVVAKKPVAKKK